MNPSGFKITSEPFIPSGNNNDGDYDDYDEFNEEWEEEQ